MEWTRIFEGALSSSPVALILGYVSWKLWGKTEAKDAELARIAKESSCEIARLNEARISDLKALLNEED